MLFRKKMEKRCAYCAHGAKLDEDQILCVRKGVCSPDGKCHKFKYDPTKRVPPKPKALDFQKYDNEDYSL